ncbi:hypothetical protein D3C74_388970 [compost metagenome]
MREHIHRRDLNGPIPAVLKDAQVAGQGCRIARHVHDSLRFHFKDGVQQARVAAFARRIDDDNVGFNALFFPSRDDVFRGPHLKGDVAHSVQFGVDAGVLDRFFDDLHTVHPFGMLRQAQGDGADTAVGINDRLLPG